MRVNFPTLRSRGVAQPGRAPALGAGCRRFKSGRPDQWPAWRHPHRPGPARPRRGLHHRRDGSRSRQRFGWDPAPTRQRDQPPFASGSGGGWPLTSGHRNRYRDRKRKESQWPLATGRCPRGWQSPRGRRKTELDRMAALPGRSGGRGCQAREPGEVLAAGGTEVDPDSDPDPDSDWGGIQPHTFARCPSLGRIGNHSVATSSVVGLRQCLKMMAVLAGPHLARLAFDPRGHPFAFQVQTHFLDAPGFHEPRPPAEKLLVLHPFTVPCPASPASNPTRRREEPISRGSLNTS